MKVEVTDLLAVWLPLGGMGLLPLGIDSRSSCCHCHHRGRAIHLGFEISFTLYNIAYPPDLELCVHQTVSTENLLISNQLIRGTDEIPKIKHVDRRVFQVTIRCT